MSKRTLISALFLLFILASISIATATNPIHFYGSVAYGHQDWKLSAPDLGDFDGDGWLDLLVLGCRQESVCVFYGTGRGEFKKVPYVVYDYRVNSKKPILADVNTDGVSDVIVNRDNALNRPVVAVYLGRRDRSFSSPFYTQFSQSNPPPDQLFALDVTSDGVIDIVGKNDAGNLVFYRGLNDGRFETEVVITSDPSFKGVTNGGDFDKDGLVDLFYLSRNDLKLAKNLGDGNFAKPITVATIIYGFRNAEVRDINNDGNLDFVAIQASNFCPALVWLGNGDLTFTKTDEFPIQSFSPNLIGSADLDGDGNIDLAFSAENSTVVRWGNGKGNFPQETIYYEGGSPAILNDIDSDGRPDIIFCLGYWYMQYGSGSFATIMNLGNRMFKIPPAFPIHYGRNKVTTEDLNNDGLKDFAAVNYDPSGSNLYVFFQTNSSGFQSEMIDELFLGDKAIGASAIQVGKFNSDDYADIIIAGEPVNGGTDNAMFFKNISGNEFLGSFFSLGTEDVLGLTSGDLNHDGILDIVSTSYEGLLVSIGHGDGTFGSPIPYMAGIPSSTVLIEDFNNDAHPDIVVSNYTQTDRFSILMNLGDGTFETGSAIPCTFGRDLKPADMDSDGNMDLVVTCYDDVVIYPGNGDGTFGSGLSVAVQPGIDRFTISDINADGRPDVSVVVGTNSILDLINDGNNNFHFDENSWSVGDIISTIQSADLNGDRKPDLLVGYSGDSLGFVKVLFNLTLPEERADPTAFDFDGDGKTDASIFRPADGEWWWQPSSGGFAGAAQFGSGTDIITPGDFTGDGKADSAVFRPSTGQWFILKSEDFSYYAFPFGAAGDVPIAADMDGDGKADPVIFRPSTGVWYTMRSSDSQITTSIFGGAGDVPAVADYDGDGKDDVAVFRPNGASGAEWWYVQSSDGLLRAFSFGIAGDKAVPGDYTGDGKADVAFYRPSTGQWFVLQSEDFGYYAFPFGAAGDIPVPGDYDGDGRFDAAVFRPSDGNWYVNGSTAGVMIQHFGASGDLPVPNAYVH